MLGHLISQFFLLLLDLLLKTLLIQLQLLLQPDMLPDIILQLLQIIFIILAIPTLNLVIFPTAIAISVLPGPFDQLIDEILQDHPQIGQLATMGLRSVLHLILFAQLEFQLCQGRTTFCIFCIVSWYRRSSQKVQWGSVYSEDQECFMRTSLSLVRWLSKVLGSHLKREFIALLSIYYKVNGQSQSFSFIIIGCIQISHKIDITMSIDQKDAQVQQHFTNMKKQASIQDKLVSAQILAKMYEKDDEQYSVGILKRIYRFISDSQDKEDRRVGLMALSEVGLKMQGSARAAFVNKFHSPVFKLFETNQDQSLIEWMEKAYGVVLELGGNQNDSAVESNFFTSIGLLQSNSKDVKKMGAYSAVMAIVEHSPYLAFKKLLQKRKQEGSDNLQVLINASRNRNIKLRQYYVNFLEEYVSYVGEKKDNSFKTVTLNRFLSNDNFKQNSEDSVHLAVETLQICLKYLGSVFTPDIFKEKLLFSLQKIRTNKSAIIQKSLIQLAPLLITKNSTRDTISQVFNFLRNISDEDQAIAQSAINEIVSKIKETFGENQEILRSIVDQINVKFQKMIEGKVQNIDDGLVSSKVQTILILLKERGIVHRIFDRAKLEEIASNAMMLVINQKTIKLISEISKKNLFEIGSLLEKKLIILISKTLTGNGRRVTGSRQDSQLKSFFDRLEKLTYLESEQNKIRAIESLSFFKFREEFQNVVGKFVKDRVLKRYLEWNCSRMRCATAEAAFNLYAKKNTTLAENQMKEILYKLLRIGMTDEDEVVRVKVFSTLKQKVAKYELFENYLVNPDILSHIFQATQDPNQVIRFTSLKILTLLYKKKPSALLIIFLKKLTNNIIMHFSTNFKYNHEKQNLIKSLSIIIQNAPSIVENHVELLYECLLGHLSDRKNYEGLELAFFGTFQVIIENHPLKTIPYLTKICKHIVQALNDKLNSKKRHQSLNLLQSIIKKCNYVIIPYFEVPGLLESLTYLLRSEISKESRIDLLRVIGGFGVLDRHKYYKISQLISNLNQDEKVLMLRTKGYNFKFLQKRKQLVQKLKSQEGLSNQLKIYYDEVILLDSDSKLLKNKSIFKHLVNKFVAGAGGPENKSSQSSSELQREQLDPYNFNIVIIINLFSIINDTFLNEKSQLTYDVIYRIFEILGKELEKDLNVIVPLLVGSELHVMKLIICIVKDCDVTPYLDDIIDYTLNRCTDSDLMTDCLEIVTYRYRAFLRANLDAIMGKLHNLIQDKSDNYKLQVKIVVIFRNLASMVQPYLSEIITVLLDKFFVTVSEVTNTVLDLLMSLATCCHSLPQYFAKISHHFSQILKFCHKGHSECKPCLRLKIGNCVVVFLITYGQKFMIFLPEIHKAIIKCQEPHQLYMKAIHYMDNCYYGNLRDQFGVQELEKFVPEIKIPFLNRYQIPKYSRKIEGTEELIHQFDSTGKKFNDSDWIQWLRKTSILLLRRSPNILLRTCADLAEEYPGLALQFYNISFFFLWEILLDAQKKQLIDNLRNIITCQPKPYILIRKVILNLVQFMNRKKCPLEISSTLLAECAKESSSHSKSLYYKELQFEQNPQQAIEDLIQIYMSLGQQENASGLLKIARNMGIECKVQWYQSLGCYQEAYQIYSQREKTASKMDQPYLQAKRIKCLNYFDEEAFLDELEEFREKHGYNNELALLACKSYAELSEWGQVKKWEQFIPESEYEADKSILKSLVLIQQNENTEALEFIHNARMKIYNEISDFIVFSTSTSSFSKIIKIQKLFELEQIVELKNMKRELDQLEVRYAQCEEKCVLLRAEYQERVQNIKEVWSDRLLGCPKVESIWSKFAYPRSLLFSNMEYFEFFYQYCEICIESGKLGKCEKILHSFKKELEINKNKYEDRLEMIQILDIKVNFAQGLIKTEQQINLIVKFLNTSKNLLPLKKSQVLFECANVLIKQGDQKWRTKIIQLLEESTKLCDSEKQLQILGNMHLKVSQSNVEEKNQHINQALTVFIRLLKTSQADNEYHLQSCLKVLGILFRFSELNQIYEQFLEHFLEVPLEVWINVTPQMIAHLYESEHHVNLTKIIKQILIHIGQTHPQSILYSLIFAARSKIPERTRPATEVLQKIKLKYPALTEQIWTISRELSNAAIKLKQFWFDGIQAAWGVYNQSKSTSEVLILLKDLREEVMSRKKTNSQIAFHHEYSQEIEEGFLWLERFQLSGNTIFLSQAFEMFIGVYRKVKESFENLKKVYLKNVAPSLILSRRYLSAIPGMYNVKGKNIKISSFYNELAVLQSKQRPRKLKIFGDDEKQYHFLLKGREDVRLDERVMQFLGLVNKLLERENETIKKDLNITRYEVIPLTVNAGLIGWVEGCDTLNQLIKDYRTANKLRVYLERENYEKICPQYAYLPAINKLEVFLSVLQSGQGKDLLRIFWYSSENSEQWVERRKNYTTSLATMSMVGYILGLGDRHPSNIMIKKRSGKIVHIDFGDCFEVAVLREKFPQKVPFRLTRMLQNAMGAAGIHGLYHQTCEDVMKVLRDNKDSLLAVLETFVHDPILSWRIIVGKKPVEQKPNNLDSTNKKGAAEMIGSIMQGLEQAIVEVNKQDIKNEDELRTPSVKEKYTRTRESEKINQKAVHALVRIKNKFMGAEWDEKELTIKEQVSRLIREAISHQNICQSWPGWCPYW